MAKKLDPGNSRDPQNIDALLAEVERTLGEPGAAPAARPGRRRQPAARSAASTAAHATPAPPVRRRRGRGVNGVVALAVVLAAVVGVAFFFLPFVGWSSGAAGAFLGALLAALWTRWRQ